MSEIKGTVVATIQAPGYDPVDLKWCTDANALDVISSVATIMQDQTEGIPESLRTRTLSITITFS